MANKAIFLDRDDTLIEDPGYINSPDQVRLLDGSAEALIALKGMGYKLVLASNQSGVARGIVTEETLGEIHKRLENLLAEKNASLDRIYYCPYHPEGVIPKYRRPSEDRKPNPGMLLGAARDLDIDLTQSWMVGNSIADVEAGKRAGCRTIMIAGRLHEQKIPPGMPSPDYRAVNIKEAVNIVKMHLRTGHKSGPADAVAEQPDIQQLTQQPPPETPATEPLPQDVPQPALEQPAPQRPDDAVQTNEQLLREILAQLKIMHRGSAFGEFSISRLIAGVLQVLVLFCLLVCIWFLLSPARQWNPVFIAIGFAILFQLMALTLYTMQGPR